MNDNTSDGLSNIECEKRKQFLTAYLRRLFGYALAERNYERIFVYFWGDGRNGKSVTTRVLVDVLGEQAAMPTLAQLYEADSDKPAPAWQMRLPKG